MQYSSTAAASSATLQPQSLSNARFADGTNGDEQQQEFLSGIQPAPLLSIGNRYHNDNSARSSFSASTCSFDFLPSELAIDSLHTQEQRRRNLDEIVERENHTRQRLRSIARLEELTQDTAAAEDEEEEDMASEHDIHGAGRESTYQEELRLEQKLEARGDEEQEQEADEVRSAKSTRISCSDSKRSFKMIAYPGAMINKVFARKASTELPAVAIQDVETASTTEKRNTNNSSHSHGSTLTSGTLPDKLDNEEPTVFPSRKRSLEAFEILAGVEPFEYDYPGDNGAMKAWLQVFASFFLLINTWGFITAFGVFQTYYQELPGGPLASPSAISLIGSIQAFLLLFIGFLGGRLFDAGYCRPMMLVGTVLVVAGLLATAWCGLVYWRILLCQGIVLGTGFGCLFTPSVAIVSTYFKKKRALANGIVATGSALGGILYPIIVRILIGKVGFEWSVTILAGIVFSCLVISNILIKPRTDIPPRRNGGLLHLAAFKEPIYNCYVFGMFCAFVGLYIPFFYVEQYADSKGYNKDFKSFYLVSIMNASSLIGRIIPNFFADKIGPVNMQFPAMFITGILILCWLAVNSFGSLVAFVIFYGFFSGAFISLPPTCMASFSKDITFLGVRVGMMFTIASIGSLIGTPIAGALISAQDGDLNGAIIFCAVIILFGSGLVATGRLSQSGLKWKYKV